MLASGLFRLLLLLLFSALFLPAALKLVVAVSPFVDNYDKDEDDEGD
mgnify:CR=1 FL=1